jgi:hypothetical protein
MSASGENTPVRQVPVATRLVRVLLVIGALTAAAVFALASGAIPLPGLADGAHGQTSAQAAPAARRTAADAQWASATCANILDWKNEIERDGSSLDLGLGLSARIKDAIAATDRMLGELDTLGLPPTAAGSDARAEIERLRADLESRVRDIAGTAGSVASGNLLAVGTLIGELKNDRVLGPQILGELRRVVSVDLGLSLAETRACRQLAGIPI